MCGQCGTCRPWLASQTKADRRAQAPRHCLTARIPSPDGERTSQFFDACQQVPSIFVLQRFGECFQLARRDESLVQRHFLDASHLEALPALDRRNEAAGLDERFVRSRVQPRVTAAKGDAVQLIAPQVLAIDVRNLQFTTRGRLQASGDFQHLVVVEVQPHDGPRGFRLLGFLFQRQDIACTVQLGHPKLPRVLDRITENRGPFPARTGLSQSGLKPLTVEDVVPQHQGHMIAGR